MLKMLHTGLRVRSMEETKNFYSSIFGLEVCMEYTTQTAKCAFLNAGGSFIELVERNEEEIPAPSELIHIAFRVDDIKKYIGTLKKHGITFENGDYPYNYDQPRPVRDGYIFFFKGPNNETIELCENVAEIN